MTFQTTIKYKHFLKIFPSSLKGLVNHSDKQSWEFLFNEYLDFSIKLYQHSPKDQRYLRSAVNSLNSCFEGIVKLTLNITRGTLGTIIRNNQHLFPSEFYTKALNYVSNYRNVFTHDVFSDVTENDFWNAFNEVGSLWFVFLYLAINGTHQTMNTSSFNKWMVEYFLYMFFLEIGLVTIYYDAFWANTSITIKEIRQILSKYHSNSFFSDLFEIHLGLGYIDISFSPNFTNRIFFDRITDARFMHRSSSELPKIKLSKISNNDFYIFIKSTNRKRAIEYMDNIEKIVKNLYIIDLNLSEIIKYSEYKNSSVHWRSII